MDKYHNISGSEYNNAAQAIWFEKFGFCGCGMPEEVCTYIAKALELVDQLHRIPRDDNWKEFYEAWKAECRQLFGTEVQEYFMWYWMDAQELTEHGGSVPGWLTDYGKAALQFLEKPGEWSDT